MNNQYKSGTIFVAITITFIFFASCKKFVEIPPPLNQIVNPIPFKDDATATATVIGIYSEMMRAPNQFSDNLTTLYAGMAADELYYYSPSPRDEFVKNEITQANHENLKTFFWAPAYKFIYSANLCVEQLNQSSSLTPQLKNTLIGESKFIRAYCYFYLVNLFGDVPLITTSDYRINSTLGRTSKNKVYEQIINDLMDALNLLDVSYPTDGRVRPNKWAAAAMLARVYLYNDDWIDAEAEATAVISSGIYTLEPDLNNVFLKDSREAIWQLMPVNPQFNTYEGNAILQPNNTLAPTYLITNSLLESFETGDRRRTAWVDSSTYQSQVEYFPYKYKVYGNSAPLTEYYMVLRLAEQYLVRAEARAHQDNFEGALQDINEIRTRAGLADITGNSQQSILAAIEQERRIELFAEWGHRWNDLKRTGRINTVLGALKPGTWQAKDTLWPIPQSEINLNRSLTQNPGY
jgi:starch-binding outer membrane protein, SusD/RagB family